MKIKLTLLALLSLTMFAAQPASAQMKPSQIAPSLSFGGNRTVFGVDSRFPVAPNISIRPTIRFPSGGVTIGTSATYDFDLYGSDTRLEPYVGAGFNAYTGDNNNSGANITGYAIGGADYSLNDRLALKGSAIIPFKTEYPIDITLGVGYKF
jgi:opacity protein-like surface antigen